MSPRETRYGFKWGPMVVERVAYVEGRGYVISVRGREDYKGPEVQVYVSEKGRVVKAYPRRGASAGKTSGRLPNPDAAGRQS